MFRDLHEAKSAFPTFFRLSKRALKHENGVRTGGAGTSGTAPGRSTLGREPRRHGLARLDAEGAESDTVRERRGSCLGG